MSGSDHVANYSDSPTRPSHRDNSNGEDNVSIIMHLSVHVIRYLCNLCYGWKRSQMYVGGERLYSNSLLSKDTRDMNQNLAGSFLPSIELNSAHDIHYSSNQVSSQGSCVFYITFVCCNPLGMIGFSHICCFILGFYAESEEDAERKSESHD